ncbi:MAG: hypothetical protein ACK53Y_25490, partial [bacterium]
MVAVCVVIEALDEHRQLAHVSVQHYTFQHRSQDDSSTTWWAHSVNVNGLSPRVCRIRRRGATTTTTTAATTITTTD